MCFTQITQFVDIGGYGSPSVKTFEAKASCRTVEDYVRSKHGFQMMYADTYMTNDEFRDMFDHTTYDKLRSELALTKKGFPEIYDKVCKSNRI
jgi:Delta24-sterol reductase